MTDQKEMHLQSLREYTAAMCALQGELTTIQKANINEQTRSRYGGLDDLTKAIRPLAVKNGFAMAFTSSRTEDDHINGALTVSHIGGHSEVFHLTLPLDDRGLKDQRNKTAIHAVGSTISYMRRYLLCMAFNAVFSDDDDDGAAAGAGELEAAVERTRRLIRQSEVFRANPMAFAIIENGLSAESGDIERAAEAYAELTKEELADTHNAPTNGGLWSTKTRAAIKGSEFQTHVTRFRNDAGWHDMPENQT